MTITTADQTLMKTIRATYGAAIEEACQGSAIPPEFLAALVANESGGNPTRKRFEKGVLCQLWEVIQGRAAHFGSIGRNDLFTAIEKTSSQKVTGIDMILPPAILSAIFAALDELSTSWGLTQIMGYQSIALGIPLSSLQDPVAGLVATKRLLIQFVKEFEIDIPAGSERLFRCWNTGRPDGATYDATYPQNGLARMNIYRGLDDEPPKAISA
jgi:hypothetical protein